jgi:hypothetical protein
MITAPPIKKPCLERWDDMRGNKRIRLCEHCQLHVQNLSAMSHGDIARVLSPGHAERVCVTYVRRADGRLVTRATLLREQFFAPFRCAFSYLLRALVPVALALCRTPQKKLLLGTWRGIERRHRANKADRITFNEDHSFISSGSDSFDEGKVDTRGNWCADEKNVYLSCNGKTYVWNIIELLPNELRLQRASGMCDLGKRPALQRSRYLQISMCPTAAHQKTAASKS